MIEDLSKFIFTIVTGVVLFFVGKWWERRQNSIQYIEYGVNKTKNILQEIRGVVQVSVDNLPVKNISVLQVSIFNRTNKDYENVELHFSLKSAREIRILGLDYDDPMDILHSAAEQNLDRDSGRVDVAILNRTKDKPAVTLIFIVEDGEDIDCDITVRKLGVLAKKIEHDRITGNQFLDSSDRRGIAFMVIFLGATFVMAVLFHMILSSKDREYTILRESYKEIKGVTNLHRRLDSLDRVMEKQWSSVDYCDSLSATQEDSRNYLKK